MNILLYTQNQLTYLKTAIKTIDYLQSFVPIDLYIADNGSLDGTLEWLNEHPELSFAAFDEGKEKMSVVLNKMFEVFEIAEDILVITPNLMIMPNTIVGFSRFITNLKLDRAIVGMYSNNFEYTQCLEVPGYSADITFDESMDLSYKTELGLNSQAFYLHGDVWESVGKFDEQFGARFECMEDFYLRSIKNDIPIIVPKAPIVLFDTDNNPKEIDYDFVMDRIKLKDKWNMNYFNMSPNSHIIDAVTRCAVAHANILEIGCDNGATIIELKNLLEDASIYGVELNETAAEIASHFAEVYTGNIEEYFPFEDIKFDFIIFGDVLEHLSDPEKMLRICKGHLSEGGKIVASIPNLMHISVVADLLKGNFQYADVGLLDRTHIHFFTYNEIVRMFQRVGLNNMQFSAVHNPNEDPRDNQIIDLLMQIEPSVERHMYTAYQYVVIAGE